MSAKAKESALIRRARKKIKEQLAHTDKRMNLETLHEMTRIIHRQLARRAPDRINLKKKTITLFDENRHPAQTESKFIHRLLNQIKHKIGKTPAAKPLEGRIKISKTPK